MIELDYLPTPNDYKITMFLEEVGLDYDRSSNAWITSHVTDFLISAILLRSLSTYGESDLDPFREVH